MTAQAITDLKPGCKYRVRVRYFDLFKQQHRPGRTVVRFFHEIEHRFNSIPCAVFSSAIVKGRIPRGELSVPHYDILDCSPA